jgi:hypothetical protein
MQGKLIIVMALTAFGSSAALAAETVRRQGCKIEQSQQRQQQAKSEQQRIRAQECRQQKPIPPVVDPTPWFVL